MRRNPWSYKIDYDKEIAQDEADIAELERTLSLQLYRPADVGPEYAFDLVDLMILDEAAAARVGLTLQDRAALACLRYDGWRPENLDSKVVALMDASVGSYAQVMNQACALVLKLKEVCSNRFFMFAGEAEVKKTIRKIKARLASHRRNRDKYGR